MDMSALALSNHCLFAAVNQEVLITLLHAGANPNLRNSLGSSPIHLASRQGSLEKVMTLHAMDGTLLSSPGENFWSPLHEAISKNQKVLAHFLISFGVDSKIKTLSGETPAQIGVKCGLSLSEIESILNGEFVQQFWLYSFNV